MHVKWGLAYPPNHVNHEKILKGLPADLPFGSWYLTGTKHFRLIIRSGGNPQLNNVEKSK